MCRAILRLPRCRIDALAGCWRETFRFKSTAKLLTSERLEVVDTKKVRRCISAKMEACNKARGLEKVQHCDVQKIICEDLRDLITIIVFDIETTGFSRRNDRIVEIAFHDISGGDNSLFQALVNPGRRVLNSEFHGITDEMVCHPGVPRMEELIPIILAYIKSRQKPGGLVVLVAHNSKTFDVPFLQHELARHSYELPNNMRFVDTLPIGREVMKLMESKGSKFSKHVSLEALREYYGIGDCGMNPHRAMSDVLALSRVLQRLTFDLNVTKAGLLERSFVPSPIVHIKQNHNKK